MNNIPPNQPTHADWNEAGEFYASLNLSPQEIQELREIVKDSGPMHLKIPGDDSTYYEEPSKELVITEEEYEERMHGLREFIKGEQKILNRINAENRRKLKRRRPPISGLTPDEEYIQNLKSNPQYEPEYSI